MERNYIAFISYRHLPLEMAVAKRLHRRIERYLIPKELRRRGQKHPGLVFRDQDELPISSDLSGDIRLALDRAEFLIVICTPRTKDSPWVMREISYFLEHHPRERVLAVLAEGPPEEAFPPLLTEIRSAEGDLIDQVEPLAANIAADSNFKRWRLFRTESLRILAALIGCPYDALYRREQRYRRRRSVAAFGLFAAVAAVFIAMLLNRNAEIQAQLNQALINESRTLAALSENAYRDGDYDGALAYALQALPGEGRERPYVAQAEHALAGELDLYRQMELAYTRSVEQETDIFGLALTREGTALATVDQYGTLRVWDTAAGSLRWQRQGSVIAATCLDRGVLAQSVDRVGLYDPDTGAALWERTDLSGLNLMALTQEGDKALFTNFMDAKEGELQRFALLDLATGEETGAACATDWLPCYCPASAFRTGGALCAIVVDRGAQEAAADLLVWDMEHKELRTVLKGFHYLAGGVSIRLCFTEAGQLLMAVDDHDQTSCLRRFDPEQDWAMVYETPLETERVTLSLNGGGSTSLASLALLDCRGDAVMVGCKHDLYCISCGSGQMQWHRTLPGNLLAARMYDNACLGLVLGDGTVTFCTDDGYLAYTLDINCFRAGYTLSCAALSGDSFPESTVVLVPDRAPQRASVVRYLDNEKMYQVGAFGSQVSHVSVITSPSGGKALCLGYDPNRKGAEAVLMDAVEGSTGQVFSLKGVPGLEDPGRLALTEEGVLVTASCLLNCETQQTTALGGEAYSALSSAGTVRSAWLGEDGTLHQMTDGTETAVLSLTKEAWRIRAVGGCGAVLLSGTDSLLLVREGEQIPLEGAAPTLSALGQSRSVLARWNGTDLTLRNLDTGEERTAATLPPGTKQIWFACEDTLLFAGTETGQLLILDAATGEVLHQSAHAGEGVRFEQGQCSYRVMKAEQEDRLLLCYDDLSRGKTICLVIDRGQWGCVGSFADVSAYLPERNCVLVCPFLKGIYLSPFRSREDIIALGEAYAAASADVRWSDLLPTRQLPGEKWRTLLKGME